MSWWVWVLVGLAGAAGAPLRYVVDTAVSARFRATFPYGTMLVNVTGSLILGLITGFVLYHGLGSAPKAIVGTGLVGAYTTFSTFSFEALQLLEQRELRAVAGYVFGSVAAGALAAAAGLALAQI